MSKVSNTARTTELSSIQKRPRRTKKVVLAYEYKRVLTVLSREVGRLMDMSAAGLDKDSQKTLIEYLKILSNLNELDKLEKTEEQLKTKGDKDVQ